MSILRAACDRDRVYCAVGVIVGLGVGETLAPGFAGFSPPCNIIGDETTGAFGNTVGRGTTGFGLNLFACDWNRPLTLGRPGEGFSLLGETLGEPPGGIDGDDVDVARGPAFFPGVTVGLTDGEAVAVVTGGVLSIGAAEAVVISARAIAGFTNPIRAIHAQRMQKQFISLLDAHSLSLFEKITLWPHELFISAKPMEKRAVRQRT
jgi:hypothetical protein